MVVVVVVDDLVVDVVDVVVVAVVVAVSTLRRCCDTPALSGAISQGVASSQWAGVANLNTEILVFYLTALSIILMRPTMAGQSVEV